MTRPWPDGVAGLHGDRRDRARWATTPTPHSQGSGAWDPTGRSRPSSRHHRGARSPISRNCRESRRATRAGVPVDLVATIAARVLEATVVPVVVLRTARSVRRLRDAHGRVLLEMADDAVTSQAPGPGEATVDSWREWDVELVHGDRDPLARALKRLRAARAPALTASSPAPPKSSSGFSPTTTTWSSAARCRAAWAWRLPKPTRTPTPTAGCIPSNRRAPRRSKSDSRRPGARRAPHVGAAG